jgi:hypothetical protein
MHHNVHIISNMPAIRKGWSVLDVDALFFLSYNVKKELIALATQRAPDIL